MNLDFFKTLRQQDIKIINHNNNHDDIKQMNKTGFNHKEKFSNSNTISIKKFKLRNPSFDNKFSTKSKNNEIYSPLIYNDHIKLYRTEDKKPLVKKKSPVKIIKEGRNTNVLLTKNNFFLTSNRSNIQSRQGNRNFINSQNNHKDEEEFIFYKKPLTANLLKRKKEGLTKGQNQLILEKLAKKYSFNGNISQNKKNLTGHNFFPSISNKSKEIKDYNSVYGFSNNMKIKNLNKDVNIIDSLKTTPRMNEKYKESELEKDGFITNKLNNNLINEDDIIVENETTEIYKETHKNECSYDRKSELDNKKKKFSNNFFKDNDDMKHKINNNEKFLGKNAEQSVIEDNKKRMPSNYYTGYDNLFIKKNSENKSIESTSDNTINPNESKHDKSNQKLFYNIIHDSSKTEDKKIKLEEINISKVLKRVVENNKKEASVRQRELYSCYPKSYLNLNHNSEKTQSHFFIGANENRRPSTDIPHKPFLNSIEYSFQNILLWKKHEEIWLNVSSYGYLLSPELEKYLLPPNEYDVLLSSYCKLNNKFLDKIVINDPIQNPNEELNKWKNAYKKTVMRWHPDKLHPLIDMLKLKDESRKNILKKKSGHIMNNMYKMMQSILEILKKIIKRKE